MKKRKKIAAYGLLGLLLALPIGGCVTADDESAAPPPVADSHQQQLRLERPSKDERYADYERTREQRVQNTGGGGTGAERLVQQERSGQGAGVG